MNFEITIPVLNEEETLRKNTLITLEFIKNNLKHDFSLCIADNGSTDKTTLIAKELSSEFTNIRMIHVSQRGVGLALKESWGSSNADVVGYMDLDLATSLEHLIQVEEKFKADECDVLYGSRLHKSSIVKNRKLLRGFTSIIFNLILRLTFKTSVRDSMCGFKFLKRSKLETLRSNGAETNGWFFCAEIVILADKLGLRLYELPVKWTDDPNSKVKIIKLAIEYLKNISSLKKKIQQ